MEYTEDDLAKYRKIKASLAAKAGWAKLTKEQRSEKAKKIASARWAKKTKE